MPHPRHFGRAPLPPSSALRRPAAALLGIVLLACLAPGAWAVQYAYPPGPPFRSCPDTLTIFQIQQSDTSLATCHPALLDTVLGVSGIITGFDAKPTGFSFYIQNTFADGPHPWTGIDIFTGAFNYNGTVSGTPTGGNLALGDSVVVYGRTQEFPNPNGETEIDGPDGIVGTNDILIRKINGGNALPPVKVGTTSAFNWSDGLGSPGSLEQWEGCLVRINGPLKVARTTAGGPTPLGIGNFLIVNPSSPSDSVDVDGTTLTTFGAPSVGTNIDYVQGILNQRAASGVSSYRIQLRDVNDISVSAPPNLVDAYPIEDNKLRLVFDQNLDLTTAQNTAHYSLASLSPVTGATLVGGAGTTVDLDITSSLGDGDAESVTAGSIGGANCPSCLSTNQTLGFINGVLTVAAVQAPDPAALGGACADRSRFAGAGGAAGARMTVRGVAVQSYASLYYISDLAGGPRTGVSVFAPPSQLVNGRRYRITGRVQEFFGETEVTTATDILDEGAGTPPLATQQTVAALRDTTCDATQSLTTGEDYEGGLVRVENVHVVNFNTAPFDPTPGGSFRVVQGTDTILVANLGNHYTLDANAGMVLDVTGILRFAATQFEIMPRADSDLAFLTSISPTTGGNQGSVSASITGFGFSSGTVARLTKSGQSDIVGSATVFAADGRSFSTAFDLAGKAAGLWDLIVTYADAHSDTLPNAFTIEAPAAPELRVSIVGPAQEDGSPAIRRNHRTAFDLVITNSGNVDAPYVPLWVAGIPTDATVEAGFALGYPPQSGGEPDWTTVPLYLTSAGGKYLAVVIPRVPPGTMSRRILLTVPDTHPSFQLIAALTPPWVDGNVFRGCLSGGGITNPSCMGAQLTAIDAYLAANPQLEAVSGIAFWAKVAWQCEGASSLANALTKSEQVLDYLESPVETGTAAGCGDVLLARWREVQNIVVVGALDPNDKLGAQGTLSGQQAMPYSIRFENLSTASAPAQAVWVDDVLDYTKLDLSTVSLDAITFGNIRLSPPPGLANWATRVDLRPAKNLLVDVAVSLDPLTRRLTWYFNSVDPNTGGPPPINVGFLPPNLVPPEGEGSVLFTVRPLSGLSSGTQISNAAAITFDDPPAMNTPAWQNSVDNTPPASHVKPFTTPQDPGRLTVQWEPVGTWPDLRDYTIYASQDGGPYWAWRLNTVALSDTFAAKAGHSYSFYSRARDQIGNVEAAPTSADAQITSPVGAEGPEKPPQLELAGARPNPAVDAFHVWFTLASRAPATLDVIDLAGRRVARREVGSLGPGQHLVVLDSSPHLRSGLYFLRLTQDGHRLNARVVLIR